MKFVSWNINGIRPALDNGFMDYFNSVNADIFCIQETKSQIGQVELELPNYYQFWNEATMKGDVGTAIFTKEKPINVSFGIGVDEHDQEGRVITLEFDLIYVVNCYAPNDMSGLKGLNYRLTWDDDFRKYLKKLDDEKPVIVCGNFNVSHKDIDLKYDKDNHNKAGFTDQERNKFTDLLGAGFTDTFRYFYPQKENMYSWWPSMSKDRANSIGWRTDYILTSKLLDKWLLSAEIHMEILGSDHCPVVMDIM